MPTDGQRASRKQERQVAAANNGVINPGSGNGWRFKNDVRNDKYSMECKTTEKGSAPLKRKELDTAETYALADGKDMVWVNDIQGKRYYTVRDYTWETLQGG